jgi:hypothetical protein
VRYSNNKDFSLFQLVNVFGLTVLVLIPGVRVQGVRGQMPRHHLPVCALLQEQGLLLAPAGECPWSNGSCLTPRCQEFKGCGVKCPGATCQFVRYSKNKDFSWLQLVNVFGLMVPVLLLGVRVQGVRGKVPWRHLPVCALLQEQGLLLAPASERVSSNGSCLTPRCQSSRGAGSNVQAPPASLCATPRTRTSPGSSW